MDMMDDKVEGYFLLGQNPAVGSAHGKMQRLGMAHLKWLVVRDLNMIESATFWKDGPEIETGELRTEDIETEVFFFPAASHVEKDGTFTQTQRMLQWHHKAVEPPGDCRSELHFFFHLGRKIRERLAGSTEQRDRPILDLTWDYPVDEHGRAVGRGGAARDQRLPPDRREGRPAADVLHRDEAGRLHLRRLLDLHRRLRRRGQPVAPAASPAGSRTGSRRNGAGRGRPTGAPCTTGPRPIRTASRGASARPTSGGTRKARQVDRPRRAGLRGRPGTVLPPGAGHAGVAGLAGDDPFIMQSDGKAWLFAPEGLLDGPLPTHYEPAESPVRNPLYRQQANPTRQVFPRPDNLQNPSPPEPHAEVFPYLFTTYRLTEHHTAGGMSRWLPYLSELQPEFFCEVSPELARERGLDRPGLGDHRHRPHRHRGPGAGHRAGGAADDRRQAVPPDRPALPLGRRRLGAGQRRLGQRPVRGHAGPERAHPGVQGRLLRHPARPPPDRAGAAAPRRGLPATGRHHRRRPATPSARRSNRRPSRVRAGRIAEELMPSLSGPLQDPGRRRRLARCPAAQGILHRHLGVHRLQGLRGGLQGVERRPRRTA